MNNYKLTVIVPVYNVENYLPKCIESIINQTYSNLEIICVNDGSTDNSISVLNEYAEKDSRIKIINTTNKGLSAARNIGMMNTLQSSSRDDDNDLITFVDSDDYLDVNAFKEALEVFSQDIDIVCFDFDRVDQNGHILYKVESNSKKLKGSVSVDPAIIYSILPSATAKIFRKSIILKNRIYFPEGILFEDNYFFPAYMVYCQKVYFIQKSYYKYVLRDNSIMGQTVAKQAGRVIHFIYILDLLYKYFDEHNLFNCYHDVYWNYIFSKTREAVKFAANQSELNVIYDEIERIVNSIPIYGDEGAKHRHFKKLIHTKDLEERDTYFCLFLYRNKHRNWYDKYYILGVPFLKITVEDDVKVVKLFSFFSFKCNWLNKD